MFIKILKSYNISIINIYFKIIYKKPEFET